MLWKTLRWSCHKMMQGRCPIKVCCTCKYIWIPQRILWIILSRLQKDYRTIFQFLSSCYMINEFQLTWLKCNPWATIRLFHNSILLSYSLNWFFSNFFYHFELVSEYFSSQVIHYKGNEDVRNSLWRCKQQNVTMFCVELQTVDSGKSWD